MKDFACFRLMLVNRNNTSRPSRYRGAMSVPERKNARLLIRLLRSWLMAGVDLVESQEADLTCLDSLLMKG